MNIHPRIIQAVGYGKRLLIKYIEDRCPTYASALSFSSLLSVIPLLAIVFAILKALDVHTILAPIILSNVAAGSHEIIIRILKYIHNTRVGSLGVAGLAALFLSIMATLDTLEDSFNQICMLDQGKKYHHKLRDYLIVIACIPLLIALAASIATSLQHQLVAQWFFRIPWFGSLLLLFFKLIPYMTIWVALIFIYKFIPNTQISLSSAAKGSFVAGTVLQFAQWCYIHFQFGVSRYNAIYGTLALLPIFMVWIYTCWMVVLAGMELVWILQQEKEHAPPQSQNPPYPTDLQGISRH